MERVLDACLKRELKEELGVDAAIGSVLGVYRHAYTHFKVTLHAFHCSILSGEPQPFQASELQWVGVSELKNYPMGRIDRRISQQLENVSPSII